MLTPKNDLFLTRYPRAGKDVVFLLGYSEWLKISKKVK